MDRSWTINSCWKRLRASVSRPDKNFGLIDRRGKRRGICNARQYRSPGFGSLLRDHDMTFGVAEESSRHRFRGAGVPGSRLSGASESLGAFSPVDQCALISTNFHPAHIWAPPAVGHGKYSSHTHTPLTSTTYPAFDWRGGCTISCGGIKTRR